MAKEFISPDYVMAADIKAKRKELGLTQKEFAELIGTSKPTIERWEASDKQITGPVVLLLQLLNKEKVEAMKIPPQEQPLRMWYMYKDRKCTLIDVDEHCKTIKIKNFTDMTQFKAFGNNESPSFNDYEDFLKSRCFPESRDKMKLILEDLDLPYYDPFLIIKKTKGEMAEDDFWIEVEEYNHQPE